MIVIGIDPGLSGAIAFVGDRRATVHDLPTIALPGNGTVQRRVHGPTLATLIRQECPAGIPILPVLEELSTGGQGSSPQTTGSQYRTRGTVETVLEMLRLEPQPVYAQKWKKFFGLTKDKTRALQVARELFPDLAPALALAKHHNRAEALLIARWGLRNLA